MGSMAPLSGKVALVTGASRGVGKGVALGLGEAGAKVYITSRTVTESSEEGSLDRTREEFEGLVGECVPLRCDHRNDAQTEAVFLRMFEQEERLDILVNSAWGGYERMTEQGEFTWTRPFWEQPLWRWEAMFGAGVRAAFACSRLAASRMIEQGSGLIVNLSHRAAQQYEGNAIYGAAKCATDRLTRDMALELEGSGVWVVSLHPGLVRTEKVMQAADFLDLSGSQSPRSVGRTVARLFLDPAIGKKSGGIVVAADEQPAEGA